MESFIARTLLVSVWFILGLPPCYRPDYHQCCLASAVPKLPQYKHTNVFLTALIGKTVSNFSKPTIVSLITKHNSATMGRIANKDRRWVLGMFGNTTNKTFENDHKTPQLILSDKSLRNSFVTYKNLHSTYNTGRMAVQNRSTKIHPRAVSKTERHRSVKRRNISMQRKIVFQHQNSKRSWNFKNITASISINQNLDIISPLSSSLSESNPRKFPKSQYSVDVSSTAPFSPPSLSSASLSAFFISSSSSSSSASSLPSPLSPSTKPPPPSSSSSSTSSSSSPFSASSSPSSLSPSSPSSLPSTSPSSSLTSTSSSFPFSSSILFLKSPPVASPISHPPSTSSTVLSPALLPWPSSSLLSSLLVSLKYSNPEFTLRKEKSPHFLVTPFLRNLDKTRSKEGQRSTQSSWVPTTGHLPKRPLWSRDYVTSTSLPSSPSQSTSVPRNLLALTPNRSLFSTFRTRRNPTTLPNHKSKHEKTQGKTGNPRGTWSSQDITAIRKINDVPHNIDCAQDQDVERRNVVKRSIIGSSRSTTGYDVTESNVFDEMKTTSTLDDDGHQGQTTLFIGGLFELTGNTFSGSGQPELDAAQLAISHVNRLDIIPGYRLKLLYNDSKCDPGAGTDAFYDLVYRKAQNTTLTMVMGTSCNEVTKTLAEIVPYWNLILISYAADSPALSEREKYRTFFRLALGHSALNQPRRMLIQHFRWKKVAALYEDVEALSLAFNAISKDFAANGISVDASASFKNAALEVSGKLEEFKEKDVRIIIAGFSEATARHVFCEAFKRDMIGDRYVWILVESLKRTWWLDEQDTSCTVEQLGRAVDGIFTVFGLNGLLPGDTSLANLTYPEFLQEYDANNGTLPVNMFAPSSYDTVWTIALTIKQTLDMWNGNGSALELHSMDYTDMQAVKDAFIGTLEGLSFSGVSGPVSFSGSDRQGISVVYQIQGGNFTTVALHQPSGSQLELDCDLCRPIIWRVSRFWVAVEDSNGKLLVYMDGKVPKDATVVVLRMKVILPSVFFTSMAFCIAGTAMAVCFLLYNLHHRRLKFIKLSSPKLNNVAVIGCILVYVVVVMLGMDDTILTDHSFAIICSTRAFLLSSGFSLAFGAIFAKTFRVHRLFTRAHRGLVKSKLIQDSHLLVIIGVLLVLDSSLVCVWVIVDPMNRNVSNLTQKVSSDDPDLIFQDQLTTCHSTHLHKWLGAFYAYKGVLLLFGVYMAWETRHVKVPALNDSQYIGMNVYNVVIMAVCVVVISNVLYTQPTLAYGMEAAFMIMSTTITLCLLFVPKICAIVASNGNPIVASTGILVDRSNTRRFVFDDRKEIYYRAEVQNRVYKRELVEMDQKISRLERLLEIPLQPIPRLAEELLYLLPESKVDGTPECDRRYRRDLERCCSISDGGEGVTYSASETDDVMSDVSVSLTRGSTNKWRSSVEVSREDDVTMTSHGLLRCHSDDSLRPENPRNECGKEIKRKERPKGRKERKVLPSDVSRALILAGFYEPAVNLFRPKRADATLSNSPSANDIDFRDEKKKKIGVDTGVGMNLPTNNYGEKNQISDTVLASPMKHAFVKAVHNEAEYQVIEMAGRGDQTNQKGNVLSLPELSPINGKTNGNGNRSDDTDFSLQRTDLDCLPLTELSSSVERQRSYRYNSANNNGYHHANKKETTGSCAGYWHDYEIDLSEETTSWKETSHNYTPVGSLDRRDVNNTAKDFGQKLSKRNALHLQTFDLTTINVDTTEDDDDKTGDNGYTDICWDEKADGDSGMNSISRSPSTIPDVTVSNECVDLHLNTTDPRRPESKVSRGESSKGRSTKRKSDLRHFLFHPRHKQKQRKQTHQQQHKRLLQETPRPHGSRLLEIDTSVVPKSTLFPIERDDMDTFNTGRVHSHHRHRRLHSIHYDLLKDENPQLTRKHQKQVQQKPNQQRTEQQQPQQIYEKQPSTPLSSLLQPPTIDSPLHPSYSVPSNLMCLAFPTVVASLPRKSLSSINISDDTLIQTPSSGRVSPHKLHVTSIQPNRPYYPLVPSITCVSPRPKTKRSKGDYKDNFMLSRQQKSSSIVSRATVLEPHPEHPTSKTDCFGLIDLPPSSPTSSLSSLSSLNIFNVRPSSIRREKTKLTTKPLPLQDISCTDIDTPRMRENRKRKKGPPSNRTFSVFEELPLARVGVSYSNLEMGSADKSEHSPSSQNARDSMDSQSSDHMSSMEQDSYLDTVPLSPRSARVRHFAHERRIRIDKLKTDLTRIQRELKHLSITGEDKVSSV